MSSIGTLAVLARLKSVLDVSSDAELAAVLQTSPQTVSSWKRRDSIPYALCVEISISHHVSLDWLLKGGDGRDFPSINDAGHYGTSPDGLTAREQAILGLLRNLDEGDQCHVQSVAEERHRLRTVEKRLEELTIVSVSGNGAA